MMLHINSAVIELAVDVGRNASNHSSLQLSTSPAAGTNLLLLLNLRASRRKKLTTCEDQLQRCPAICNWPYCLKRGTGGQFRGLW